jgi:hypothetical protein
VATGDARSYFSNAWWIESAQGLVLIDALCLRSDVDRLIAALRATDKPLVAVVILTHADPSAPAIEGSVSAPRSSRPDPPPACRASMTRRSSPAAGSAR